MKQPNWHALRAVNAEARRLMAVGRWTHGEYEKLLPEAETAVGPNLFLLEGFYMLGSMASR